MTIPFSKRITISKDSLRRELDEESVILSLNRGTYYGLDGVGNHMLSVLLSSDNIQQAYERLLIEYDVDAVRLRADLEDFIQELLKQGLVHADGD